MSDKKPLLTSRRIDILVILTSAIIAYFAIDWSAEWNTKFDIRIGILAGIASWWAIILLHW